MLLFYILLTVYVLAVNFYSFLYIFALHKAETQDFTAEQNSSTPCSNSEPPDLSIVSLSSQDDKAEQSETDKQDSKRLRKKAKKTKKPSLVKSFVVKPVKGFDYRLLLCAALGGAITIYICMFIFRYKLNNLFLMLAVPILAAANGYFWFILFTTRLFARV